MSAANTDKLLKVGKPGTATTLSSPGHTSGGTSITVGSTTNWPTDTGVAFAIDRAELVAGEEVQIPGTYTEWIGVVSGATTITDMVLSGDSPNSDQTYASGSLTRVYIPVSATRENKLVEWGLTHADQDGTLKAGAVDVAGVLASNVVTYPKLESELQGGWNSTSALPAISTVVANGNRSYTLTHASSIASVVSPGMRRRFTRTSAAPITCFSLDGSNDYFNDTTVSGMTFTDDFVVSAWVKLSSYPAGNVGIVTRYNGTSGWVLGLTTSGGIYITGYNAGSGNYSGLNSYQSIPLNKWVHVTAQLDMSTFTATTTTSYVMFDGVNVPGYVGRAGTNPTALIQAGNLEIGSANGGANPFPGKIAQVAIYSAKVTQATILASIDRGLTGSETSLISAYSGANTTDLASTGNNLTAQNGAVSGYADAPFGNGGISSTIEYGLTMSVSSDGLTEVVQCPEGCALPTTGGITASAYSSMANPYGWVEDKGRWQINSIYGIAETLTFGGTNQWASWNLKLTVPIGAWIVGYSATIQLHSTVAGQRFGAAGVSSPTSNLYTNNSYKMPLTQMLPFVASGADTFGAVGTNHGFKLAAQEVFTLTTSIFASSGTETAIVAYNGTNSTVYAYPSGL